MTTKRIRLSRDDCDEHRTAYCGQCGYPMDIGDVAFTTNDDQDLACSRSCAEKLARPLDDLCSNCGRELNAIGRCEPCDRRFPPHGQTLSCFI